MRTQTVKFVDLVQIFTYQEMIDEFCDNVAASFGDAKYTLITKQAAISTLAHCAKLDGYREAYVRLGALDDDVLINLEN